MLRRTIYCNVKRCKRNKSAPQWNSICLTTASIDILYELANMEIVVDIVCQRIVSQSISLYSVWVWQIQLWPNVALEM